VRVRAHLGALKRYLTERGHARHTVYSHLDSAAHCSRWAQRTDLSLARIDEAVIALWLGHQSPDTAHRYVEADLARKEEALARLEQPATHLRRYRPPDALMAFLQQL
jgi:integrase